MYFKTTTDTTSDIYRDAIKIRRDVFVKEQNVDESLEIDDLENKALHIVGYSDKKPVCTARLILKSSHTVKIQRVAVIKDYRNKGVGLTLLKEIEKIAGEKWSATRLELGSQNHAIPFYEKYGFTVEGEEFLDAGIPHHFMYKEITAE